MSGWCVDLAEHAASEQCTLVRLDLHSNQAFALVGLGLAGVIAEQVAALTPVTGHEVQLASAAHEGRCIHVQVIVILQMQTHCQEELQQHHAHHSCMGRKCKFCTSAEVHTSVACTATMMFETRMTCAFDLSMTCCRSVPQGCAEARANAHEYSPGKCPIPIQLQVVQEHMGV